VTEIALRGEFFQRGSSILLQEVTHLQSFAVALHGTTLAGVEIAAPTTVPELLRRTTARDCRNAFPARNRKVSRLLPATWKGVWEMIKGKLSIFILSLGLIGATSSAWAQRTPRDPTATTRVPEPATGLLLLTGLAGGMLVRQLRKRRDSKPR